MRKEPASQPTIAALYQRCVLDPLVELARNISDDAIRRPGQYRSMSKATSIAMEGFRKPTGSDPEWLSAMQRTNLFSPIFDSPFWDYSAELKSVAVAMAEHGGGNSPALAVAVRDAAATLRGHLQSVEPAAVANAADRTEPVFRNAIEVICDPTVAAAFGQLAAPEGTWPMDAGVKADAASSDGARLIEAIQTVLDPLRTRPRMSQHRFVHLQRAAYYGALTISAVLDEAEDWHNGERIQSIVNCSYSWEKAVEALLPSIDVVRVWKDRQYRHGLSACERAIISPHPSGVIDLNDAKLDPAAAQRGAVSEVVRGYSTRTYWEICCSTGDVSCITKTRDYCGTNMGFTCVSTGDNLTCFNCDAN